MGLAMAVHLIGFLMVPRGILLRLSLVELSEGVAKQIVPRAAYRRRFPPNCKNPCIYFLAELDKKSPIMAGRMVRLFALMITLVWVYSYE